MSRLAIEWPNRSCSMVGGSAIAARGQLKSRQLRTRLTVSLSALCARGDIHGAPRVLCFGTRDGQS